MSRKSQGYTNNRNYVSATVDPPTLTLLMLLEGVLEPLSKDVAEMEGLDWRAVYFDSLVMALATEAFCLNCDHDSVMAMYTEAREKVMGVHAQMEKNLTGATEQ